LTAPALSDRRLYRIVALLGALLLLATFAPLSLYHPPRFTHAAVIAFDPVPLDEDAPQRSRIGSLVFLQGWALRSDNPGFGGISALHVDGRRVTGLSDTGVLSRFDLPDGGARAVRGRLDPLPDGPGPPTLKSNRDSESMLIFAGHLWAGFERHNEIWRYASGDGHPESHAAPPAMKHWPYNTGPEAMVRLDDGRFLVFAENAPRGDGTSEVVLFDGDPAVPGTRTVTLGYRPPDGYRATDAALLPDGRILILNRRVTIWEGFSARLVVAALPELAPGAVIAGREIAALRSPVSVDNMEGLSVTQEAGRTILWIVSDDNFFPLQRTLLLKFALDA